METDLTPCMAIRAPLGDACMAMGTNGTWKGLVLLGDAVHGHLLGHTERESQGWTYNPTWTKRFPPSPALPLLQSFNQQDHSCPPSPPAVKDPPPCRRVQHLPAVPYGRGEAGQVRLHWGRVGPASPNPMSGFFECWHPPPHQSTPLCQSPDAVPPPPLPPSETFPWSNAGCRASPPPSLPPIRAITADDLIPANFMPSDASVGEKQKLPACDECRGCTTNLTLLVRARGEGERVSLGGRREDLTFQASPSYPLAAAAAATTGVVAPHPMWPLACGQLSATPSHLHSLLTPPPPLPPPSRLQISSGSKFIFGREFVDEGGASPNWLFLAPTTRTATGKAIVKVGGRGEREGGSDG